MATTKTTLPYGYWQLRTNQRKFFDELFKKLNLKTWEDWYTIDFRTISKNNGKTLMARFKRSPSLALTTLYPEYPWKIWKFCNLPKGYWKSLQNQKQFFDELSKKFGITNMQDWYNVSCDDVLRNGGWGILAKYRGSLTGALKTIYSNYKWEENPNHSRPKSQVRLFCVLRDILPEVQDIHFNYMHPTFTFKNSMKPMIFDIFIPSLKVAFEYQGEQHFQSTSRYGQSELQNNRDLEKKKICEENGITYFSIPYWWDSSKESLRASIYAQRPDIIGQTSKLQKPIPDKPKGQHNYNRKDL